MIRAVRYFLHRAWHAILRGPRALLMLLLSPFVWIGTLLQKVGNWWGRRETRHLVRGLPSILVFGLAAFLILTCRFRSDAALAESYLLEARRNEQTSPATAALLLERVVSLRPADEQTLFELASMAQQAGDQTRASVLIQQLAPETGLGYFPAHLQVGRYYLARQHLSEENYRRAELHLRHAQGLEPNDASANALLGQLYFMRGVWAPAILYFEAALDPVATGNAEPPAELQFIMLLLAKAHAFNGNPERAEQLARGAHKYFTARLAVDPDHDFQSRIILADTSTFLEDYQAAAQVLADGLALQPQNAEIRSAIARFSVAWSDAMRETRSGTRAEQLELLSKALLMDPNYAPIFDRMMRILTDDQDEAAAAARKFLLDNVAAGKSIALSHLLLGSAAYGTEDAETAAYHLERANELLPDANIVKNNLAWFLAFNEQPDLPRALQLIDDVLRRDPDVPGFRDTRGQIYAKLGRWDEAIDDLENALSLSEPETHLALATCYEAKGMTELARSHRSLAETAAAQ
jgi:tetratricopeptide (TPR) repeat protein